MTPGARIQASIELLAAITASSQAAERVAADYVRARRFIGSKDRRAITDRVFAILRAQARLDWCWARAKGAAPDSATETARAANLDARARVLAALVLLEGQTSAEIDAQCDTGAYSPDPLSFPERGYLDALASQPLDDPEQPLWVRCETPEWLLPAFEEAFGDELETELKALAQPAPVDLRVNTLRAEDRSEVADELAADGIAAIPTRHARHGLRLATRRGITGTPAFKDGQIEVQDEAAQVAAALVQAEPGMAVCDLCAGAGGKTLALAADMDDTGRLVALDKDDTRLAAASPRLSRAGVRRTERRRLMGTDDPWLTDNAGAFDRVLVDVPCTGTGTWRRQPDTRWRLTQAALDARMAEQQAILEEAAALVRPGGRLIYVTCSLVPAENTAQIEMFRETHPAFIPQPIAPIWRETVDGTPLADAESAQITLTPARHGTDGFFIAVLRRNPEKT